MRILRLFLSLSLIAIQPQTIATADQPPNSSSSEPNPGVVLTLSDSEDQIQIGEGPISMKIEMQNNGKEDFCAARTLGPIVNGPAFVEIDVTNQKGET